ncbi:mandelate racemase/muconate lactonizing enzyme family protein [Lentzea sp. NPDC051838]|uniref:mandelate racemase/muconate lactonizing enzyme family protein n=1 Tax=Lentzea sp. NPDC051838 TaxID=3154849 RepID=UPI00341E2B2C
MAKVVKAEAFQVDVPVETLRTDAVQQFVKQETVFVEITTDDGATGLGYAYTIGTGGSSVLALLKDHLLPRLEAQDTRRIEHVWQDLFASTRATTVGAITSFALAAIDTALWDLHCRRAGEPLWRMAGGHKREVPLYDTEGGWLHLSTEELVKGAKETAQQGWQGIKMKVGKPDLSEDVERLEAVREAVGERFAIMVDANQSMTAAEAIRRAEAYKNVNLTWLEEPMPADDVSGHVKLAQHTTIPIAVGESLYSVGQFREYLERGAASIIQVDAARIGGITPFLKVAHTAEAFNADVCPHFLMELHVSLAAALPNGRYVEHIPQLRAITKGEITIHNGHAIAPDTPGLGIDWDRDAMEDLRVA